MKNIPRILFLFDIDGTLINAGELSVEAYKAAFLEILGEPYSIRVVDCAGRTDPFIVQSVLSVYRPDLASDAGIAARIFSRFLFYMHTAVAQGYKADLLPQVFEVLELLQQESSAAFGLLTGNLEQGAYCKLAAAGIDAYFDFGAFGSDHSDRNMLGPIARTRAEMKYNTAFDPSNIWIVGDSVHDISCAKAAGFRSLAVATGRTDRSSLVECDPDLAFDRLTAAPFSAIIEDSRNQEAGL